jgi:hypothetical protein
MSAEPESIKQSHNYTVTSIEKVDTPDGYPDGDWHRYVIAQGESVIEGFRTGTLNSVKQHAEGFAEDLNARGVVGYSTYSLRKKK